MTFPEKRQGENGCSVSRWPVTMATIGQDLCASLSACPLTGNDDTLIPESCRILVALVSISLAIVHSEIRSFGGVMDDTTVYG